MGRALRLGMLFKTFSAAVFGIDAYLVEVEADVSSSYQGGFNVVGFRSETVWCNNGASPKRSTGSQRISSFANETGRL